MKERPILFSGAMVRALLAGTKTQTRRVVKLRNGQYMPPSQRADSNGWVQMLRLCPYGQPGDRLWVREAWRTYRGNDKTPPRELTTAHYIWFEADEPINLAQGKLRPGMFMPRWASRITLEVTGVRVERLQDISEADAIAEGIERTPSMGKPGAFQWCDYRVPNEPSEWFNDPARSYQTLWEQINGPGSWDANPWVWVVEFKRLEARHG